MNSESLVMYRLKPVLELKKDISVPTNMYKMRNLHSDCSVKSAKEGNNDDLILIEKRQEVLLQKLDQIKNILSELKSELAEPKIETVGRGTVKMCSQPNFSEFGITHDVVLNISIKKQYPPYSLLVINKIWPEVRLKYSWHLHSSAQTIPPAFKQFQEQLDKQNNGVESDLNIKIVWKAADTDCEFVISPVRSVPLIGEVNFLRFLSTAISSSSDVVLQTLIDEKLDACFCLARSQQNDDIKSYLKILANGLKDGQWLCGSNISVVDIAAWSVFKQMKKHNIGLQPLNDWYRDCSKYLDV